MLLKSALPALAFTLALPLMAQQTPPSQLFDAKMLSIATGELLAKAKDAKAGLAVKILTTRPDGNEQLVLRLKSGQGEWHRNYVDVMVALEGEAQVITGGKLVNGKETEPGEMRGDSVSDGKVQTFHAGEMLRIEPQVPHQMLIAPGTTFKYFAVKIKLAP